MKGILIVLVGVVVLLAGCSNSGGETKQPLTKRQRDSTLAETELPGAKTVGRAVEIADSAAARRDRPLPESN